MAERQPQKARKQPAKLAANRPQAAAPKMPASPDLSARIKALEDERDQLARELEVAKLRVAALEQAREQALNRIDWVIDSLHNLQDE